MAAKFQTEWHLERVECKIFSFGQQSIEITEAIVAIEDLTVA